MPVLQERVFDGRWAGSQCREERPRESLQSTTLVCTPSPHLAEHCDQMPSYQRGQS